MYCRETDVVIIGGGPAGLAAALAVKAAGVESVLVLERDTQLGGILNQCIHNGFGLHTFKEELTGPEYAARFIKRVLDEKIEYMLETMVVDLKSDRTVVAMNRKEGLFSIKAGAVVLAMGCRERPRGALGIPGFRPAGIFTAGTAQRFVNVEGIMPGSEVVILGSGDIGLIMARRMTLEGAHVKLVAELMPYSGGLKRNIAQCLNDYNIPLKLSHTVVDIKGKERVEGVTIAEVDERLKPIPGTEEFYPCDTLLLSCGLIPENELSGSAGVALSPVTGGAVVDNTLETSIPGVFACGNVLHVHDLVDYVSEEAENAGKGAAEYVKNQKAGIVPEDDTVMEMKAGKGVRYTVPAKIRPATVKKDVLVRFRVDNNYKDVSIGVFYDGRLERSVKKRTVAPGEMEELRIRKEELDKYPEVKEITIGFVE
ncbi:MAG: FAD-dependent oxidoreductase [Lachnospiraceae bacterium]|nr:FAD-dependent oxidoreductase [Lachnospiraceae bacterium]